MSRSPDDGDGGSVKRYLVVAAFVACLLPQASWGAIAFVQAANTLNTGPGGATSVSVTMSGNAAGDFLAVACRCGQSTTQISSVTDTAGNTYTLVNTSTSTGGGGTRESALFYAANIKSAASNTISCNYSAGQTVTISIVAEEFSGVATSTPTDGNVTSTLGSGTGLSISSGSITTTNANDLLIYEIHTSTTETFTAGTGYTIPTNGTNGRQVIQYNIVSSTGTYSTSISFSATAAGDGVFAAFKAAVTCGAISDPTYVAVNAQPSAETVYWSSPTNPNVVVLRRTSAFSGQVPANGTTYSAGMTIGGPATTVVYAGPASNSPDNQPNGTYYYKVFAQAAGPCYSPGTVNTTSGVSATPSASPPAWSYAMAGGSMLNAGIAGSGAIYTSSNANWLISLNTATGTQNWAPAPTTAAVQGWLTWVPLNWADNTYLYREKVTITAGATAVPTGYAVPVTFNHASLVTAGKALATGNDVRVFYWNGTTWVQLDRALDSDTINKGWNKTTTQIWFKTQAAIAASGSDGSYYLYYGNPSAVNPPANKANVFLFADDFEAGNLNKWTILAGNWQAATDRTHSGSYSLKYYVSEGGVNRWILANPALNQANVYLDVWWNFSVLDTSNSTDIAQVVRAVPAAPNASDYEANLSYVTPPDCSTSHNEWEMATFTAPGTFTPLSCDTVSTAVVNTWTRIGIGIYGNPGMMRVFKDGVQINPASGAFNVGTALASGNIGFRQFNTLAGGFWWLDDVVARLYVDPEPTTALSAEQASTGGSVIGGDQGANVYALDATSGAQNWTVTLAGANAVQAAAAVQMRMWSSAAFQSAYSDDVVFVATRNGSSTTNTVYALKAKDGTVLWNVNTSATNPTTCPCNIDYIVGEPLVDYGRDRIYVASRAGATGAQNSLWIINSLNGAIVQQLALTHLQTSPTLSQDGNTIYVANVNNAGTAWTLYAIDATSFATRWTYGLTGALKGFVWQDPGGTAQLYFSTANGKVSCVKDNGATTGLCGSWGASNISVGSSASNGIPLDAYYVGSSDGKIHMINLSTGLDQKQFPTASTLDGANTLGDLSTETGNELFVGTSGGKLFKIPLPLP